MVLFSVKHAPDRRKFHSLFGLSVMTLLISADYMLLCSQGAGNGAKTGSVH